MNNTKFWNILINFINFTLAQKVYFTVMNPKNKDTIRLKTAFSWSVSVFFWTGIPFFKRRMYFTGFLCLVTTMYYFIHILKIIAAVDIDVNNYAASVNLSPAELSPQIIIQITSKYFNLTKEVFLNIISGVFGIYLGYKANKWGANGLIKKGWAIDTSNLSDAEQKIVQNYLK